MEQKNLIIKILSLKETRCSHLEQWRKSLKVIRSISVTNQIRDQDKKCGGIDPRAQEIFFR